MTTLPSDKAALFAPVLAWLDSGAMQQPFGFNMAFFNDQPFNGCKTVCCIAGALAQFHNIEIPTETDDYIVEIRIVADFMGMAPDQVNELFYANVSGESGDALPDSQRGRLDQITPAQAAHAIRTFLAAGKCDWSRING